MQCILYRNHTASKKDATQIIVEMGVDHALPGVGQGSVGFGRVGPGMGVPGRKGEEEWSLHRRLVCGMAPTHSDTHCIPHPT